MQEKTPFNWRSPHFWLGLLSLLFGAGAVAGISFPSNPGELAGHIVTTISQNGFYSVLGLLAVSVVGPIVVFIQNGGPKITWSQFFGSTALWIYVGGFVASILIVIGIEIPAETPEQIVAAIYAKDWATLGSVVLANVLNPLIRWIKARRAAAEAAALLS